MINKNYLITVFVILILLITGLIVFNKTSGRSKIISNDTLNTKSLNENNINVDELSQFSCQKLEGSRTAYVFNKECTKDSECIQDDRLGCGSCLNNNEDKTEISNYFLISQQINKKECYGPEISDRLCIPVNCKCVNKKCIGKK